MSTTRSRRATPPRRGARRRPRQPFRRSRAIGRRPNYSRRVQAPAFALWKIVVVAVAVAVAVAVFFLLGVFRTGTAFPSTAIRQILYTAGTANDARFWLPESVKADQREVGLQQGKTALTRIDSTGEPETSIIDLTGRDTNGRVLKVADRSLAAIDTKIGALESLIRNSKASTGGHALFTGLTKARFSHVPVTIVSSGLDLSAPVDFRSLNWNVDPARVVAAVKQAGELPDLAGAPVTFVVVPSTGAQDQLRQAQRDYRNKMWTALLTASGASSVTFIEAEADSSGTRSTRAPAVPLPPLPETPITPTTDLRNPRRTLCALPSSTYFRKDEAVLIDKAKTVRALQPCITAALAAQATIDLDGWTSYEGLLTPQGKPSRDAPENRKLSAERVRALAELLVKDMQVSGAKITHLQGHGNVDQPYPDPRDPANRVVIVSYLVK
jgi:hypothetical protein